MRGMMRASKVLGAVVGHRAGLAPDAPLLSPARARWEIFVPSYRWVLEHRVAAELAALRALCDAPRTVVLLDYETNGDPDDLARPLSHAALVARYLAGTFPEPPGVAA